MTKIKNIIAREILDSRGNPTIETAIVLDNKIRVKASVPSGASTGIHEAWELRDGDNSRYGGLGVRQAVKNVNNIINRVLKNINVFNQREIDDIMIKTDGTKNKKKLGANAILSASLACARAGAAAKKIELYEYINTIYGLGNKKYKLPTPCFNIFNGGKHADTNLDFQEFMIIPHMNETRKKTNKPESNKPEFSEQMRMGAEIFHQLGKVLKRAHFDTDVGNEGGYAPDIISSIQAIELIIAAIIEAGYRPGQEVSLGIDVGSSQIFNRHSGKYIFKLDKATYSSSTLVGLYHEWLRKYPLLMLEDGLAEDDWQGWGELTKELGDKMILVGDDVFTTNINRFRLGLKNKIANAILIKPNQIGTLSETVDCVKLAQKHNYRIIVSHRSGETCDDFIADLAVAVGADFIKAGSLSRGERVAKYNRLMEIEDKIL